MGASQTFFRLYGVFMLVLILVLVTLGTLPKWRPAESKNRMSALLRGQTTSFMNTTSSDTTTVVPTNNEPALIKHESESDRSQGPEFELVLSHYAADNARIKTWTNHVRQAPYIKRLGMKLTIYTKNPSVSLAELKTATGADEVHRLPNVGREGHTILRHLIKTYNTSAPKFTMFAQDEPEWALQADGSLKGFFRKKLWMDFRPNSGFLGLNDWNELCSCGDCGGKGQFPLQVAIYNVFEKDVCHGDNWNNLWSQFIVSRERVRSRALKSYQWLEQMLSAPKEHWVHAEQQPDFIKAQYCPEPRGSTSDNPLFGHTVERSWGMIFQCSYPERVVDDGMGVIDERHMHCWDWKRGAEEDALPLEGLKEGEDPQRHWPGFEEAEREFEREEEVERKKVE